MINSLDNTEILQFPTANKIDLFGNYVTTVWKRG